MNVDFVLNDPKKFKAFTQATFKTVDKNGNGSIDLKELTFLLEALSKEFNLGMIEQEDIINVMDEMDINKNKTIELEEFDELAKLILLQMKKKNQVLKK